MEKPFLLHCSSKEEISEKNISDMMTTVFIADAVSNPHIS